MEYRNTTKNLRQIARELGVGTILEGAVQRVGDNVRINAQLIDAETDRHLWAQTFDRQLSMQNIFAIQSEISEAITGALKAALSPDEQTRLAKVPTENLAAYDLYQHGRDNVYKRRLETLLEARTQFEQATRLDPNYADAYAGLADSVLLLFNNHAAIERDEALSIAQVALDRALTLNPDLADAYASLGLLKQKIWEETRTGPELEEAEVAYTKAIELNPNHPRAYMWFATLRSAQQRFNEAIALHLKALQVDPLGRIPYANLPGLYAQMDRNVDALELNLKAVRIHPEFPTAYTNLAAQLTGLGRLDEAISWGLLGKELSTDPLAGASMIGAYIELGEYDKAWNVIDLPDGHPMYALGDGIGKMLDMDFTGAVESFEQIVLYDDNPRQFMFSLLATSAMLAGDYDKARAYAERNDPNFAADADPSVDRFNVGNIVRYAYILQKLGENQRGPSQTAESEQR